MTDDSKVNILVRKLSRLPISVLKQLEAELVDLIASKETKRKVSALCR